MRTFFFRVLDSTRIARNSTAVMSFMSCASRTERNRNRHARLVENRTNQHHGGGAEEGGVAEEIRADDDGRKPGDHRAGAHRNVEETLLLTHDRARERNQRIRNNQTKDFDRALVAAERCDDGRVVARRAQEVAALRPQEEVKENFCNQRNQEDDDERGVGGNRLGQRLREGVAGRAYRRQRGGDSPCSGRCAG